ncbi:protein ripply3 isoform X2 [Choloepus didactylus]|uniref:protein ripply3 isoform X2 n=1 Tax=Choloepus didactylus TaxID=27675 RepID=UPI0018A03061|nr:protein ripply3 isoform X2 [Choloepus didactylus]
MRPEAARGRVCHCPGDGPRGPPPPHGPESPTPWRPWLLPTGDAEPTEAGRSPEPGGDQTFGSKGAFGFQHPVRLYLPISKRQEYLQSSGEKVLACFPVQATIHFYNDESDSEDEDKEHEPGAQALHLPGQGAEGPLENDPGGQRRAPLVSRGRSPRGSSGLFGKGQAPHRDPPGEGQCSSSQ